MDRGGETGSSTLYHIAQITASHASTRDATKTVDEEEAELLWKGEIGGRIRKRQERGGLRAGIRAEEQLNKCGCVVVSCMLLSNFYPGRGVPPLRAGEENSGSEDYRERGGGRLGDMVKGADAAFSWPQVPISGIPGDTCI